MRKYIRSEQGHQGYVYWNKTPEYDNEMARQMILRDRPKTKLKEFKYKENSSLQTKPI